MIAKTDSIVDVINTYPEAVNILQKNGVHCMGCLLAHSESIFDGLTAHGLDAEKVIKEIEATEAAA